MALSGSIKLWLRIFCFLSFPSVRLALLCCVFWCWWWAVSKATVLRGKTLLREGFLLKFLVCWKFSTRELLWVDFEVTSSGFKVSQLVRSRDWARWRIPVLPGADFDRSQSGGGQWNCCSCYFPGCQVSFSEQLECSWSRVFKNMDRHCFPYKIL